MNYIGSKHSLLPFLDKSICETVGDEIKGLDFCDLFGGTGAVGRFFKRKGNKIIANDWEYYSYVLLRNYIGNHRPIPLAEKMITELNQEPEIENGFIYQNYCIGGSGFRQYFSDSNGRKIDAIRVRIENWRGKGMIDDNTYYFLLCSLLEAADKVANTASVYGAYLKHLKQSAKNSLELIPAEFWVNEVDHEVYRQDANNLIRNISGDILYLDPPYNTRQYGANYHLLNTIAMYKPFEPIGKTGLPVYQKSKFSTKRMVKESFEDIVRNARFKYIFLSYNNEGIMSLSDIASIMHKYGDYSVVTQEYQRFKADKNESREHKADRTTEYIHILVK